MSGFEKAGRRACDATAGNLGGSVSGCKLSVGVCCCTRPRLADRCSRVAVTSVWFVRISRLLRACVDSSLREAFVERPTVVFPGDVQAPRPYSVSGADGRLRERGGGFLFFLAALVPAEAGNSRPPQAGAAAHACTERAGRRGQGFGRTAGRRRAVCPGVHKKLKESGGCGGNYFPRIAFPGFGAEPRLPFLPFLHFSAFNIIMENNGLWD